MANAGSAVSLCAKYTMFFINFLLFLVFSFVVGIMAYAVNDRDPPVESFLEWVTDGPCVLLFFGCSFFVMTAFGWLGALRENVSFLRLFAVMLIVIILLEIAAFSLIFLLVYVPDVTTYVYDEDTYRQAIARYRDVRYESLSETIDYIQQEFKCCGVSNDDKGYLDWSANEYFNCTGITEVKFDFCSVPHTCCRVSSGDMRNLLCGQGIQQTSVDKATREAAIYTTGCFKAFVESLGNNIQVIAIVAICVLIPEFLFLKLGQNLMTGIQIQQAKWFKTPVDFDRIVPQ